jgi:hypothetical protein
MVLRLVDAPFFIESRKGPDGVSGVDEIETVRFGEP